MADLVNLRLHRKRKHRAEREEEAARNRALHGRSAAEKAATRALGEQAQRRHEAGRIERSKPDEDASG